MVLALAGLLSLTVLAPTTDAATLGLREVGTGLTEINAGPGEVVNLELFLETGGLSFEGYLVGLDVNTQGGSVSGIGVAHQSLPGLFPDLFGAPVIDQAANTVRNNGQTTFTTGLGAGTYVLDIISLTVDAYGVSNPIPGQGITVTPGLFGEVLGLAGGSCPGTAAGCSVSVQSANIVPEPGTALLVGLGLLGLGASGSAGRTGRAHGATALASES